MSDPTNPYAVPQSNLELETEETEKYGKIRLLSSAGRIGRLRYMAYSFFAVCGLFILVLLVNAIAHKLDDAAAVIMITLVVIIGLGIVLCIFILLTLSIQRLHDMNINGLFIFVFLITPLNLILTLALMFIPGSAKHNRFGAPPPPNTIFVSIFGLVPLFIILSRILWWILNKRGF